MDPEQPVFHRLGFFGERTTLSNIDQTFSCHQRIMDGTLQFRVPPCEASDGSSLHSSHAIARSDDHIGPHLDPALPGVQKVAAKNLAFGFLDLRLRLAMPVRFGPGVGLFLSQSDERRHI
jgi:hypothetical protein